ncbi:hypothetical protein [Leucobacter sp. NPDC077196]|uniref:hypothetical protein n=1 Tax=Leucobacter sp. NPDC077196 TaxID=3154959 RepID=UPI00344994A0
MRKFATFSLLTIAPLLLVGCASAGEDESTVPEPTTPPSVLESILQECDLPEDKLIELDDGDSAQFMISGKERSAEGTVGISFDDMECILGVAGVKESTFNKSRIGDDMVGDRATVTFTEAQFFQVVPE